jgi:hypothetical protein
VLGVNKTGEDRASDGSPDTHHQRALINRLEQLVERLERRG